MKNYLKINNQYLISFKDRNSYYDKYKEVYKIDNKEFEVMETDVEMVTLENLDSHDVLKVLKEDPYQLIQVDGVTFSKIDKMVLSTSNLPLSFKNRIIEGVKYAASQYMNNSGNTIINHWELYEISKAILNNDGLMYNKESYYLHE